jgi:hypothetical protein
MAVEGGAKFPIFGIDPACEGWGFVIDKKSPIFDRWRTLDFGDI